MKQGKIMNKSDLDFVSHTLKVLGHPARISIVMLLEERKLSVTEISKRTQLPQAVVSLHLNVLRTNNILANERHGKKIYYYLKLLRIGHWIMGIPGVKKYGRIVIKKGNLHYCEIK